MAWRMLSDTVSLCYTMFAVILLPLPLADTVMMLETVSCSAITSTQDNLDYNKKIPSNVAIKPEMWI